jgi:hypothetical protein
VTYLDRFLCPLCSADLFHVDLLERSPSLRFASSALWFVARSSSAHASWSGRLLLCPTCLCARLFVRFSCGACPRVKGFGLDRTSSLFATDWFVADWMLNLRDVKRKVRRVLLSLFLTPATIKKRNHSNQLNLITHLIQSHTSIQREK